MGRNGPASSAASTTASGRRARLFTTPEHAARSTQGSRQMISPTIAVDSEAAGEQKLQKRHQIATACGNCREAKIKCSGQHPQCTRCRARCLDCAYDVAVEGVTRREWVRRQFVRQMRELERCNAILAFLRSSSDSAAAAVLACLRMGDSLEQVHASLHEFAREPSSPRRGSLPLPLLSPPPQRLAAAAAAAGRKDSMLGGDCDRMAAMADGFVKPGGGGDGEGPDGSSAYSQHGVVDFDAPSAASLAHEWPDCWDPALLEEPKMQTTGVWDMGAQETVIMETD